MNCFSGDILHRYALSCCSFLKRVCSSSDNRKVTAIRQSITLARLWAEKLGCISWVSVLLFNTGHLFELPFFIF
jgi:hypothetical protein